MATTYVPIATQTLGSAESSVTFSNIPATYTDLVLVVSAISSGTAQPDVYMQVNSSSANYSRTRLGGNGSSTFTTNITGEGAWVIGPMENTASTNMTVHLMNYSNSTTFKTALIRSSDSAIAVQTMVGLWRFTNAITSIYLYPEAAKGNFAAGSTFSLYGVAAWTGGSTPKATGGNVFSDATYWYHAFPFSSTFTPNQSISADVLVVAGGGGGGGYWGGGGGAGGLLPFTSQSLTATNYTVTVGGGGAGGSATFGNVGGDSQFGALTLVKGGGLGGYGSVGGPGGSGGGGGYQYAGGSATSGQGNAGGSGSTNGFLYTTGGGGGAGAVGGAAASGTSGSGGAGVNTYSTWASATSTGIGGYYAGGGGGGGRTVNVNASGAGGLGGGGAGGSVGGSTTAANGTAGATSTGSGGGGSLSDGSTYVNGGNGGSGLVIVRYPI